MRANATYELKKVIKVDIFVTSKGVEFYCLSKEDCVKQDSVTTLAITN